MYTGCKSLAIQAGLAESQLSSSTVPAVVSHLIVEPLRPSQEV